MKTQSRRSFLKASALSGGGFMLGISFLSSFKPLGESSDTVVRVLTNDLSNFNELNGFVKITADNVIKIMSPNPEGGQGVKTSMPMIVAEELDVDFSKIIIEQADLDTKHFTRQFIGGSQAIHQGWASLRLAGATARQMLRETAAKEWSVPVEEISTELGVLFHKNSGKSAKYGEMATAAAQIPVPKDVKLKEAKDFKIIGKSQRNVDLDKIVSGKPLFGIDTKVDGMLIAMIVHPPAMGLKFKAIQNDIIVKKMKGIKDVFPIKIFNDDYEKTFFDTTQFNEVVAIVGSSTWEVMQAKNALKVDWQEAETFTEKRNMNGRKISQNIPAGLENSNEHFAKLTESLAKPANVRRKDGDVEIAFKNASKVIERTYNAPFLAHNCMEPMNFFAHVTDVKVSLSGPLQKPEFTEQALSARLGIPLEKIDIKMTRLGGGFGRRSYAHWLLEAALISQKVKAPIKLIYTREDDMTAGIYRPTYTAKYRAALDVNNNLIGFHVKVGGMPQAPLAPNRFPAGAVDNYLAEDFTIDTNITVGSYRAPHSNFMAAAEQSFLDEVAETAGKDPIAFRIDLLKRAKENPVGKNNDYDANRFIKVLELVREKSNWESTKSSRKLGFSAYFCHDSYAAHVLDLEMKEGSPQINKVWCAIDCGIVVNPNAAKNMAEGGIVDAVGAAMYGKMTFSKGMPESNNFHSYRMIRHNEAPKSIEVHFVENTKNPTGMGEPAYPPVYAALANALYKATGKRLYSQPFGDLL
ncbi:aldehyde oxidase and xanthine dehydrogenase molybdopterin binding protein (plasmid) [Emticicia oligotrophica DSM 17448]|uniref:Aldehyde oxidase and xanthine dehydrogenase molybdopterin binding protein n=1 Tax=Emticicia oligotrophica (strain DSM 17448 / CIP 109782 / MTCC 6937 / GPTSA100-15) TaxID=929562 RepID=A0ABM5N7P9_EMTOG|nr:molybdopterin cofactor-binding domain-containing protein [Emticicia oligotrophica]AFK05530.1 aldehyde oxidase and xanthine dehydrogenase molybdopterin binding protein [Emticicia oligotrophica DSM 17448]